MKNFSKKISFSVVVLILCMVLAGCQWLFGDSDYTVGETVSDSKQMVIVTQTSKGFKIRVNRDEKYIYTYVCIRDKDQPEIKSSVQIGTDKELFFPYVTAGKTYEVYLEMMTDGWKNWCSTLSPYWSLCVGAVEIEAIGGSGELCFDYDSYYYDTDNFEIVFDNFTYTKPDEITSTSVSGKIKTVTTDDDGETVDSEYLSGATFDYTKNGISAKKYSGKLRGVSDFYFDLYYSFQLKSGSNSYSCESYVFNNKNRLFSDTNKALDPENTGLPKVYVSTLSGSPITSKDNWVDGTIQIFDDNGETLLEEKSIQVKGRGNSTWGTGKNPYTFKLESGEKILGLKKHKRWVLMANYFDRAMVRNRFAGWVGTNIFNSSWNAQFVPVNLYINGFYAGTYDLGEQIKINKNRVNIQSLEDYGTSDYEDVNDDGEINLEDGGFIVEIDCRNGETYRFYSAVYGLPFNFRDPDVLTDEEFEYAKEKINSIERMFKSSDFANNYRKYIDVDSFIDWYLLNEFARNTDAIFQTSVYMYYDPSDGLMHMGPNWDFDLGFGNDWDDYAYNSWYIWGGKKENSDNAEQASISGKYYQAFWINRLFEDNSFKQAVKQRWTSKSAVFNSAINGKIQEFADEIAPSIPYNEELLPRIGQYSWNGPNTYKQHTTYQLEVDYMIDWCNKRYNWMDSEINKW